MRCIYPNADSERRIYINVRRRHRYADSESRTYTNAQTQRDVYTQTLDIDANARRRLTDREMRIHKRRFREMYIHKDANVRRRETYIHVDANARFREAHIHKC